MFVDINEIVVKGRIRKDFGNIEELANDIRENGLINPPVVTPDMELIAGERRLRAMKYLGWPQVEVRVMTVEDAFHQLKLEISENENRKDFTFSEKMDWAERLKEEYRKIAEANTKANLVNSSTVSSETLGRVDQKVAEGVGLGSYSTLRKAEYIRANADEEMIRQLDEGQLSINGAYVRLKKQAEEAETKLLEKDKQIADLQAEAAEATRAVKASTDSEEYMRAMKAKEDLEGECRKEYEARKVLETKVGDKDKQIAMLREQFNNATKKLNELQRQKEVMSEPEVREVEVEVEVYPVGYEEDMAELEEFRSQKRSQEGTRTISFAKTPEEDSESYYNFTQMTMGDFLARMENIVLRKKVCHTLSDERQARILEMAQTIINKSTDIMDEIKKDTKEVAA